MANTINKLLTDVEHPSLSKVTTELFRQSSSRTKAVSAGLLASFGAAVGTGVKLAGDLNAVLQSTEMQTAIDFGQTGLLAGGFSAAVIATHYLTRDVILSLRSDVTQLAVDRRLQQNAPTNRP